METTVLHVQNIDLWSHVGVLECERIYGQRFSLDFSLWIDEVDAFDSDNINSIYDYSRAITAIQELSSTVLCFTIEYFSTQIIETLQAIYGNIPIYISLSKVAPPVNGFSGTVSIERRVNFADTIDEKKS